MHATGRRTLRRYGLALLVGLLVLTGCGTAGSPPPEQKVAPVTPYHYRPPQPAGRGPLVVAVGDMVCAGGQPVSDRTCRDRDAARLAAEYRPTAVLALGDQQYGNGSLATYRQHYARTWGRFRAVTKPVPGDEKDLSGYYSYFAAQTQPPGYYAFDVGSWRVYALNDNCTRIDCDAELAWLDQDMAANPRDCSAIMLHTPLYGSGIDHGGHPAVVRPFWRVALAHGTDLALAGHLHQYERFPPMGLWGRADPRGMASFIAGTGGASMRPLTESRAAHSEEFDNSTAGVLSLRLQKGRFSWRYRNVDQYNIDAGSRACH